MADRTTWIRMTSNTSDDVTQNTSGDIWWYSFCGNTTIRNAFWSHKLTVDTANPDLTNCFQDTVLIWVPYGFLWASLVYYLPHLLKRKSVHTTWQFSLLNSLKVFIGIILIGICFLDCILRFKWETVHLSSKIASFIRLISLMQVTFLLRLEFLKGIHTSLMFLIFWLMLTACNIVRLRSQIIQYGDLGREDDNTLYIIYFAYYTLITAQFIFTLFADTAARGSRWHQHAYDEHQPLLAKHVPKEDIGGKKELPELSVPAWSRVSFLWVMWDVIKGYRHPVTFDDLYELKLENKCSSLLPSFYHHYKETQAAEYQPSITTEEWMSTYSITSRASISIMRQSKSRRGCSWRCPQKFGFFASVFWSAGCDSIYGMLLMCLSCGLVLLQPQILKLLIIYIPLKNTYKWQGVALALALFVISLVNTVVIQQLTLYCWCAGLKTRTVINSVVYRKAMRLSMTARKSTTVGEIVNLMSVDAQKVQDAFSYVTIIGQVPLLAVASFYFIYDTIGVATFAGVIVLLILLPFNGLFMANMTQKLQAKQMRAKDQRLKRMNEILSGIKILKLYAWEPTFIKKLLRYRDRELVSIKYANILNALSLVTWILCPFFLSLAIFSTYVLLSPDNILTAEKIFVTLSYINTFNYVISLFPVAVGFASQGYVSLQRLSKFMKMQEIQEDYVEKHFLMKEAISIEDGSFRWEKSGRIILKNINLEVQRGQLIAVVGQVGAGKSSLISALLGEMTRHSGSVKLNGSLAYVPQQAWIQNETVKENILFGKQFIGQRYEDVIYACALKTDLKMLPGGDMTEIGEKGINLSGGQKQRVSVARAVYQNEDIYLLDDPLSAVDAHVGKHIFEKVIGPEGLLRKKTRILVTHGISFLPRTDTIVVIKEGRISEVGKYQDLLQQNGAFAEFLRNHLQENEESDASDETKELQRYLSAISGTESEKDLEKVRKLKKRRTTRTLSNDPGGSSRNSLTVSVSEYQPEASKLIEEEAMKFGSVKWSVIGTFIKAAGDRYFMITVLFNLLFSAFNVITNIWLSDWSRDVPVNGSMPRDEINNRLGVYGSLGGAQTLSVIVMMLGSAYGCLSVSNELHYKLLKRVMNAPLSWFDRTPLGRIMNRFSKDMDIIDTNVPFFLRGWLFGISPLLATLVIICYTTPLILVIVVPFLFLFFFLQRIYIRYAGQLRRIDAMRRSPIFAHFDESVTGTTSIRAYNRLTQFTSRCNDLIDESQQPYYMSIVGLRWLGVTMEVLGAFLVFFSALFAVLNKENLDAGMVGLSVTFALQVVVQLNSLVRCSAEMEMHMVSVERIDEYCEIEQEAAWRIPNLKLPFDWPTLGHIKYDAYCTRYRSCLDLCLRDINLNILPSEKVGIVGRTGAGKSSLALGLFRIIEAAGGSITIDGFRLEKLGLHDVRSRLTIIPQDPVIFSGTLRDNLDPFEEYADDEIWNALDHTNLSTFVRPLEKGLYYACGESGESLSVGQRQLICLARALLRRSRVLILDEATAAVDLETDALIQQTIRTAFHECTVLTIAHRIHTVLDYDKIMVLDKGRVLEFDKPSALLDDRSSMFFGLAQEAGLIQ